MKNTFRNLVQHQRAEKLHSSLMNLDLDASSSGGLLTVHQIKDVLSKQKIDSVDTRQYLVLDYETFSEVDLKKVGGYEYSKHPSTEILCVSWRLGTRLELKKQLKNKTPAKFWAPRWDFDKRNLANKKELFLALGDPDIIKVAHNAMFEQVITLNVLSRYMLVNDSISKHNAAHWLCTASLAASHALPRSLEDACKVMDLPVQKDMEGRRLILKWCKPRKASKNNPSTRHTDAKEFKRLVKYCMTDVDAESYLFLEMPPLSEKERNVWVLDQKINLRGFLVDRLLVNKVLSMIEEETKALTKEAFELSNGLVTSPNQRDVLLNWLKNNGCFLPDLQKKTIEDALKDGLASGKAKRMLQIRQAVSKTSTAKYNAFNLRTKADGRLRDSLMYWAASTGRWGGKGVQPQNFPRGTIKDTNFAADICSTENLEMIRLLFGDPMEVFSSILRNMIIPLEGNELFVSDYAGIEARMLFWVARHAEGVQAFKENRDLYKEMAVEIYKVSLEAVTNLQRQVGKQAVLGCGYGMGWKKFKETCMKLGIEVDDETARKAVASYRDSHAPVTRLWKNIEQAAIAAVLNPKKQYKINRTKWFVSGKFLYCELPSGRRLAFFGPEIRYEKTPWGDKAPKLYHWAVDSYTKKWKCSATYGGKLVENVIQAISRDLMAEAMLRIENDGFMIDFSVHDELIGEAKKGTKSLERFDSLMAQVPEWAKGAPIKVEGWFGPRYRK